MRTFDEIKKEVADGKKKLHVTSDSSALKLTEEQEEIIINDGNYLDSMLHHDGWKLINKWILDRLNIQNILHFKTEELIVYQQYVRAYTDLFGYINGSVIMRDKILDERRKKDGKEQSSDSR